MTLAIIASSAAAYGDDLYVIGPKDVLSISVYDEPDLTKQVVVDANGNIRFPMLREVNLGGLTIRQAEERIENLLGERYLVDPQVSISIKEYHSKKVFLLGAVKNPGFYPLKGTTTLLQVISEAGGVTAGGGSSIVIVKDGIGKSNNIKKLIESNKSIEDFTKDSKRGSPIVIDGYKLLREGDTTLNRTLENGDIVYIPSTEKVFVLGEVKRPGAIAYQPGLTLLRAITLAGGVTEMGRKKVLVKRIKNGVEERFKVKLKSMIQDSSKDITLLPDDVIVVPRRVF